MKHKKMITAFALLCALSMAACGGSHAGPTGGETPVESQTASQAWSRNESQTADLAENQTVDQTENRTADQTENRTADQTENRTAGLTENRTGNGDADAPAGSAEEPQNLDDLLQTTLLRGSVADFEAGRFWVVPDQEDGASLIAAAPGMEDLEESTPVSYDGDCIFQIANIDISSGAVELEAAASSDVKKSTSVYVCGEARDNGEIHASKVLIPRYR